MKQTDKRAQSVLENASFNKENVKKWQRMLFFTIDE